MNGKKYKPIYNIIFWIVIVLYTACGLTHGIGLVILIVSTIKEPLGYYYKVQTEVPGLINSVSEYWFYLLRDTIAATIRVTAYVNLFTVHNPCRWKRTLIMGVALLVSVAFEWSTSTFVYKYNVTIEACRNLVFFMPYLLFAIYQKKTYLKATY